MSAKFFSALSLSARAHRIFLLLFAFYLLCATFMLDKYPRVWVDEPWESVTAYTLVTHGALYNPALENWDGFDKVLLQPRLLLSLVLAPVFAVFGVGHIEGRLASVACGALLMIAVYLFTQRLYSRRAALIAVWFVTIETMMFIAYRTIRPEIYLVALETFSMMLLFQGFRTSLVRYFLGSGILSGIALWTHPNAVLHVVAISVLLVLSYRVQVFASRSSWSFVGGVALGLLPYLVYVIVNDAHNSFATLWLQLDERQNAVVAQNWLLTSMQGEWARLKEYAQFPYRVPILLLFAAVWFQSLRSKRTETQYLAVVVAVNVILLFLLISNKTVLYFTSILPILCILTAASVDGFLDAQKPFGAGLKGILDPRMRRESVGVVLFIVLSANQLAGDANLLWRNKDCSYTETIRQLHTAIPPNAKVWGSMTFWFGFYQQPFRAHATGLRELESFKPEYMITGDREVWGKEFWKAVREKADDVIERRGTLVAELPESCYGRLRVYRLQW